MISNVYVNTIDNNIIYEIWEDEKNLAIYFYDNKTDLENGKWFDSTYLWDYRQENENFNDYKAEILNYVKQYYKNNYELEE